MSGFLAAALLAAAALALFYFLIARGRKAAVVIETPGRPPVELTVEVADNPILRAKGLMGRRSLGENEGMLFRFPASGRHAFWMFNTPIPLEALFLSEDGTVEETIAMQPCGLDFTRCRLYTPRAESKSVLEVKLNFSKKCGVVPGKSKALIRP